MDTTTMVAVAAQSRQRVPGFGLCVPRSGFVGSASWTHRVPSQKDNVLLHSATRLTQGVPWLCGPVLRRVCSVVALRPCWDRSRRWAGAAAGPVAM